MAFKNTINNTELYNSIHSRMRKEHKKLGKRWGIYSSSELIRRYKKAGGTFKTKKNTKKSPLSRWFKEDWINVCEWPKIVKCGRSSMKEKFPYCRPLHRISKNTPKTIKELSNKEIKKRCKLKRENPETILSKSRLK